MPEATFHFPRKFLWGTATASHQVEGNNKNNNWWAWEQEAGRIADGSRSGLTCDWWGGRWKEDFDRAAESGQNAHRLSIEWSRVQPTPDRWDESALEHYRSMLRGLKDRGMTSLVTLHHFTDPIWLSEIGGWENADVVGLFAEYVRRVVTALKEYTNTWITINEPNVVVSAAYLADWFPPGKKDLRAAFRVMENFVRAHAAAYHVLHEVQTHARVGLSIYYRGFQVARQWFPPDRIIATGFDKLFNDFFPVAARDGKLNYLYRTQSLSNAKGTQDFLGLNYYTQDIVKFDLSARDEYFGRRYFPENAAVSPSGMIANQPSGFFAALKWAKSFGLPIIVTENGIEDAADTLRPQYIAEHIRELWRAVNFNYPIEGYFHWTLVDNFEWHQGWTQRFGLWELDIETQKRTKRASGELFEDICKENGLSSEMVERYAPGVLDGMFPGIFT